MNQCLNNLGVRSIITAICCYLLLTMGSSVEGQTNTGQGAGQYGQANSAQLSEQQRAQLRQIQEQQAQASNAARGFGAQQAAPPRIPEGFNLTPKHEKFLNELLDYWQKSSDQVQRYTCDYMCWEYDPEFCNWRAQGNNKLAAFAVKSGKIRFQNPDRARYETTKVWGFAGPPENPGGEPKYKARDAKATSERWVCDGKSIYEFDYLNKRLMESKIPAEMQGKGLANSPIPFLFGASKEEILNRYWIRVVTPENVADQYWLEAFPKRRQDASTYKKIELILARKDFLPKSLTIYAPNYDPVSNPVSRVFEFNNRKINGNWLQTQLNWFIRPTTPLGWKRVVLNANQSTRSAAAPQYQSNPTNSSRK